MHCPWARRRASHSWRLRRAHRWTRYRWARHRECWSLSRSFEHRYVMIDEMLRTVRKSWSREYQERGEEFTAVCLMKRMRFLILHVTKRRYSERVDWKNEYHESLMMMKWSSNDLWFRDRNSISTSVTQKVSNAWSCEEIQMNSKKKARKQTMTIESISNKREVWVKYRTIFDSIIDISCYRKQKSILTSSLSNPSIDSMEKKQSTRKNSELRTEKTNNKRKLDQADTNIDSEDLLLMKILWTRHKSEKRRCEIKKDWMWKRIQLIEHAILNNVETRCDRDDMNRQTRLMCCVFMLLERFRWKYIKDRSFNFELIDNDLPKWFWRSKNDFKHWSMTFLTQNNRCIVYNRFHDFLWPIETICYMNNFVNLRYEWKHISDTSHDSVHVSITNSTELMYES